MTGRPGNYSSEDVGSRCGGKPGARPSKVFTAVINLVAGVAVISLLSGVARTAVRTRPARPVMSRGMQPK